MWYGKTNVKNEKLSQCNLIISASGKMVESKQTDILRHAHAQKYCHRGSLNQRGVAFGMKQS